MPNYEALKNYKPVATYTSPRNQLLDMIIKRGYARYQAEAMLNAWLKLYDKDSQTIARIIVSLKGNGK